ncbi:MAG: MlaD family protein [Methylotetracoccus sp.]|nr:MlaD family protein [Methylotetracoccus sp.]
MSKPINPVAIGGFTVGALALLVIGLLIFGGGKLFETDIIRYVIFFESSLNGLDVGAPVKMQGVKVGDVKSIALQFDREHAKVYKPVVIEIDRKSFLGAGGKPPERGITYEQQKKNRDKLVDAGFRARLETQSLLTGLLYVDIDLHPDKAPQFAGLDYQGLIEIPCVPTTVDEIRNTADEVFRKVRELPLDRIVQEFSDSLKDIRALVGSEEAKRSNVALAKALEGMDKTIGTLNRNLEPLLKDTHKTMTDTNALVQDSRAMVRDVHKDMKPVLTAAETTLAAATTALNKAQAAVMTVEGTVGPESTLNETLIALKGAARSLKELTDYLERHPEAVISGKSQ